MKAQYEHISGSSERSFDTLNIVSERFGSSFHYHPEIEITLITQGKGTRIIGDHIARFEAPDLCILGSNLPHIYHSDEQQAPEASRANVVQFPPELLSSILETPEMLPVQQFLARAQRGLHLRSIPATIQPLLEACHNNTGPERILALLQLLQQLASIQKTDPLASLGYHGTTDTLSQSRLDKACQYIFANFDEAITLDQVAKHTHLSPASLSRLFRKLTNKTFVHFIRDIRLGYACRLLADTDDSIVEICFRSGFRNLSNFNRQFKAQYQRSPRDWRKSTKLDET